MADTFSLVCPVRGRLKVTGRSADGLTPSEEKFRVEAIRYLVEKGYPKSHFVIEPVIKRFGNAGRNSFRADFAVLDVPAESGQSADWLLSHALVLAEIKRDSSDAVSATEFQVKPLLAFAGKESCVAIYWDNVDQRVFWRTRENGESVTHEGPIEDLPAFGHRPGAVPMTLDKLRTETPLRILFERIEDVLHAGSIGPSKRFTVMLQLLLAKIFDEHNHDRPGLRDQPLTIQDFRALRSSLPAARTSFNELLARAANYYKNHLPEPVPQKLEIPDGAFLETMSLLAPHKITAVKHSVIQDFYMYFAKGLYKWDLAQYFTPPSITDFIVDVLNPQWDEHVHDPACGSADFLTATFRRGQALGFQDYADHVWGSDVSAEAVQVAVLNMVLNGDGKSNIKREDSLANVDKNKERWDAIVCNPPFGKKIVERAPATLKKFDMGCIDNRRGSTPLASQETGILFTELCVRIVRPGGRIAIVVPNGYLGNSSPKYRELRKWLLRHTRVAAIVGLPRFSFKTSGADVSTSILFLEKRDKPLKDVSQVEPYDVAVQVINKVGWSLGDKKATPMYVRDQSDGAFILDDTDEMILDSDFAQVQANLRASSASQYFPWLTEGIDVDESSSNQPHTVDARSIVADDLHTIDPKLLSSKHDQVRSSILSVPHFRLGDVVDIIPERISSEGKRTVLQRDVSYDYVELQNVESGTYRTQRVSGWALPERARHTAEPGDFYVGGVWSSVRKWMLIGKIAAPTIVTNGMHRFRMQNGMDDFMLDVVAGLCSEAYAIQMRARARGSDGLAEIRAADLQDIVLPRVTDPQVRVELHPFVMQLLAGFTTVEAKFSALAREGRLPVGDPDPRSSHVMIV